VAITVASGSVNMLLGIAVMDWARLLMASPVGTPTSFPASIHGSLPKRANTDNTLRAMPLGSVPTDAYRNSSKPDRRKAKAFEPAMSNSEMKKTAL
jgi:hypothetical protein